jgi:hypothetical protein
VKTFKVGSNPRLFLCEKFKHKLANIEHKIANIEHEIADSEHEIGNVE